MKARFAPKRLSHSEAVTVTETALRTVAPAVTAAVLFVLYRRGWHKDRLHTLYKEIVFFFSSPAHFDKWLTNEEIESYIADKVGIDWSELENAVKVERT